MTTRTHRETVTFHHPFTLSGTDGVQPAGSYTVETEEESIESVSFLAYRRVGMTIFVPLRPGLADSVQSISLDARELELCLARDQAASRDVAPVGAG